MNIIKNFKDYLKMVLESKEKDSDKRYKYGCVMLFFDFPKMGELHDKIEEDDIYSEDGHGLESEPHCTLLYGLHDEEIEDEDVFDIVMKELDDNKIKLTLFNASLFENDYDVLKFDVKQNIEGEDDKDYSTDNDVLYDINKALTKDFPFTTDFPDYHSHCTVGYLNKGSGKKYVKEFKDQEYEVTPKKIVYSKSNGDKIERVINKKDDKKEDK